MMSKLTRTLVAAVCAAGFAAPVLADDNGLAAIHDFRREGGRLCFADHWHYGTGSGGTRKAAQADAISNWSSFTALEYGSDWARFNKASSKSLRCQPNGGGSFDCQIEGRPCK